MQEANESMSQGPMEEKAESTAMKAEEKKGMVVRKMEEASQKIEGMGEESAVKSSETMSHMSKTVSTYMRKGSEYLDQMDVQEELKNLETNVRKNPLQSVLITAGAGLVLGMLLRGR